MAPAVVFPDTAALCIARIKATLPTSYGATAFGTHVPNPRPTQFVLARRVGGALQTPVTDAATITFECWAATDAAAHDLAQACLALIRAMAGTTQSGTPVYRVGEFAGPTDLPDPLSSTPRFVFTVAVHVRGVTLDV